MSLSLLQLKRQARRRRRRSSVGNKKRNIRAEKREGVKYKTSVTEKVAADIIQRMKKKEKKKKKPKENRIKAVFFFDLLLSSLI